MNYCANHPNVEAVAYCRTCGKPLCGACRRDVRGVIYCENCLAARMEGTVPTGAPVVPVQSVPGSSGPNPTVAGILAGFFPFGVGAVYTSQYAKGLAHLLIFAGLIWGMDHASGADVIFGLSFAFFYVYQIIDAVRTARAIQLGQPAPDPFGLGQALGAGEKVDTSKIPTGAVVLIAVGVLQKLHEVGITVPRDMSLVGYDDIPLASMAAPPLTTVAQPVAEMSRLVVASMLSEEPPEITTTLLSPKLVVRSSTATSGSCIAAEHA